MLDVRIVELRSAGNARISDPRSLTIDHAAQQGAAAMPEGDIDLEMADGDVLHPLAVEMLTVRERDQTAIFETPVNGVLTDLLEIDRTTIFDYGRVSGCAAGKDQRTDERQRRDAAGDGES